MLFRCVHLISKVSRPSNLNLLSQRCASTLPTLCEQHKFNNPGIGTINPGFQQQGATKTFRNCHGFLTGALGFQQPCARKSYYSITRANMGRSEEEIKKIDYVYDPKETEDDLKLTKRMEGSPKLSQSLIHNMRIQPKKLILAANLVQGRSLEDALAQTKFSDRRACHLVHEALLQAKHKAHEKGLNRDLLWVQSSSARRESVQKRMQYHGRGRFGVIHSYYSSYRVVLAEGKPPLAKKEKRRWTRLNTQERALRYPKTIKNSLSWY